MAKLAKNIMDLCGTLAPYSYVLAVVGILVIGVLFALPSQKTHDFAKSYGGYLIIGVMFIAGCVTVGKWLGKVWAF